MPQRALFYECFAGISGDMHLGALVDVGVPREHLTAELAKLELADEFELVFERSAKMGVSGTKATVRLGAGVGSPLRHLATIKGIIERARFTPGVQRLAIAMFETIGAAEAKIHGVDIEQIHFHEVGATDSIVDIVGAAVGLAYLDADAVFCSPVEVGSGMVRCQHGLFPVPAPATAEILQGVPCKYGGVEGEATTPTGAAILKCAVDAFEPPRTFKPSKLGYGLGQKDFAVPNALRLTLGEIEASVADGLEAGVEGVAEAGMEGVETETNIELECNIDDMPAEAFAPLMDGLFAHGAKDVFLTPIVMKKARPGTKVSVLVDEQRLDAVMAHLFTASTTIGARLRAVSKRMLPRREHTIPTSLGEVRVKVVTLPNGAERWKPEHDDIVAIAARTGDDYLSVKSAVRGEVDLALRG